jgi:hypothetical protein
VRRPHLLTPAGKRILRCLRAGEVLRHRNQGFELGSVRLHTLMVLRLIDAGYVERVLVPMRTTITYRLTAAGREALEER